MGRRGAASGLGASVLPVTPPRLVSGYFGEGAGRQWPRMARVLQYSASVHCPGWDVDVRALEAVLPPSPHASPSEAANVYKLQWWCAEVEGCAEGARVLLIDVDTVILQPLDAVWDLAFDVAYTARRAGLFPLNAGVIALRVSDRSRRFLRLWLEENYRMLADQERHRIWRRKYAGMNQAALGCLLESGTVSDVHVRTLPCAEWNCEDSSWRTFNPSIARILHVKSQLRRAALGLGGPTPALQPLVRLWRQWEQRALAAAVAS